MTKFIPKLKKRSSKYKSLSLLELKLSSKEKQRNKQLSRSFKEFSGFLLKRYRYRFWVGVGISSSAIALGLGWWHLESSLPDSVDEILTYARKDTLTIQAADGSVLQEIGPVSHEQLKSWEIPENLLQAFIASEDRRFYEHHGVDYLGIIRAALSNVQAGDVVEGGSTITQQLSRLVFLDQERSLWRKLKEMRLAQEIDNKFEKKQILERYLNLVYLGSGAYGVADASWVYFDKPVDKLSLPEAAMIAGLAPAPSIYSPFENPEAAKKRRNLVLQSMAEDGVITAAQAEAAIASPLNTKRGKLKRLERQAPYFTEYIQEQLPQYVSPEALKKGGLTVETTLHYDWQKAAEETIEQTIQRYGTYQRFKQAALVAIDPRNGQIKAMVGGDDFYKNPYNRVTQAQRQPGSTFKTFVYTTAIAAGFSPYKSYLDADYVIDGYHPKNYSNTYRGWVTIRDALISSLNIVAVRTLVDVGWEPVIEIAQKMGIESKLKQGYSLALGASEVSLLELTSAYGTLANQGVHSPVYAISRILDQKGNVIYQHKFASSQAVDQESAAIITWMLQGVVTSGTGRAAQIGRPVAGKTGTSDQSRDLWFVGYIPQLVTGVWLGNDDNKPTWGASSTAAAGWHQFMLEVVADLPVEKFSDRPSKLDGRKGTIQAKPIKPQRSYYTKKARSRRITPSRTNSSGYTQRRSSTRTTQPAPKRRYYPQTEQPVRNQAPKRAAPAPAPAPVAPPAPAPPAPPAPPPPAPPAPAPVAPPAPPQD